MGKNLEQQYAFRCDTETIKKLEYIAKINTRTRNQEMKHIIKQYIQTYEIQHGEIKIEEQHEEPVEQKSIKVQNSHGVVIGSNNSRIVIKNNIQ